MRIAASVPVDAAVANVSRHGPRRGQTKRRNGSPHPALFSNGGRPNGDVRLVDGRCERLDPPDRAAEEDALEAAQRKVRRDSARRFSSTSVRNKEDSGTGERRPTILVHRAVAAYDRTARVLDG
jgi:hypothetical protein